MAKATVLAYLAGAIDSDGFVTVQRSRGSLSARIGISGTRRQLHDLAASVFGGNVTGYQPRNPRHRVQYHWSRNGPSALVVIEAVRPYLLLKARQADLAVRLQNGVEDGDR